MIRLAGISASLLCLCLAYMPAAMAETSSANIIAERATKHYTAAFALPGKNWFLANRKPDKAGGTYFEYIPTGTTLQNWEDIFILYYIPVKGKVDPLVFASELKDAAEMVCPDVEYDALVPKEDDNGSWLSLETYCQKTPEGVAERSQYRYFLGEHAIVSLQKTRRGEIAQKVENEFSGKVETLTVCPADKTPLPLCREKVTP